MNFLVDIEVTLQDVRSGIPGSCRRCAIARAATRAGFTRPTVTPGTFYAREIPGGMQLSADVVDFIRLVDSGKLKRRHFVSLTFAVEVEERFALYNTDLVRRAIPVVETPAEEPLPERGNPIWRPGTQMILDHR